MTEVDLTNQPIPEVYIAMEELSQHKGENDLPIWIGVNGLIFQVSEEKRHMYQPGTGYSIFAGTDATRALAKSSVNAADLEPYGSLEGLTEKEMNTLNQWIAFYKKRYVIVGKIKKD